MLQKKALIGMSGGVDSSVAAFLTIQEGFSCLGGTMLLHEAACGGSQDVLDAAAVAGRLGIPHHVLDGKRAFEAQVIVPFVTSYEQGLTPNPCILCNRHRNC